MVLRAVDGVGPTVHEDAYVDDAVVIGDVTLERAASVWRDATLRGDHSPIVVGVESNVQDNAVLGPRVTVATPPSSTPRR